MTDAPQKILIVDDVEANLLALLAVLEGLPCEVEVARSGNEALRALLKGRFVAMLLDVQMPGMDGFEVAHHARSNESTRDVPIIFLTAKQETEDDVLKGYGTGAVDYLFKPVSPIVLRSKVRVFLELDERRRKLEQTLAELTATQTQLIQSAKMAALGELVAGVAHEINNPLAFVMSHLKTIQTGLDCLGSAITAALSPEQLPIWEKSLKRFLQMNGGLERISDLVVQLRTFSRLDEGVRQTIDIRECIDSVLMILGHRIGDEVQVSVTVDGPESVECFPGPLNLAILNLVANAIDALEGRGKIDILTGVQDGQFVLSVVDDGVGIPAEILDRIFEPFFTTKPVGHGTGLGLSISYSIAKRHGGTLLAKSSGGTTEMTVQFPLSLSQGS